MAATSFDVVIVGAGAAGLTAAIGLARSGFSVAVVEAAVFPGAENWSGCVYFCENLAHPDILGPQGVEELAWERRLVERGFFATDGHGLLGMKYRDPDAFRHCYTVLRPIVDHHLAQIALKHGVALLTSTTAESLIRNNGCVIGVCTNRGPIYANLTFLAEGDASHLVTREGYESFKEEWETPKFLHGIKEVLELPPRVIEERFGVGPEQGVAYEMLLRNGTLRGKRVHLNAGGFIYTNRQSLSVGLVLPADNLHEHFDGDPNLLLEWFENLPALQPWLRDGKRLAFGAKIIRGGGAKEIPRLIDDGLAIGGAASGVGVDFPYPNFTGPATGMGLLLVQAVRHIRAEGGPFTRDALERHYLEPLRRTHYWQDVEFLRHWPEYVKKTSFFFDNAINLGLGSAYLWTRPGQSFFERWRDWQELLRPLTGAEATPDLQADLKHLRQALHLDELLQPPAFTQLLLDGALNTARDLVGRPRVGMPPTGELRVHYTVAGGAEPTGLPPAFLRHWFARLAPIVAAAARQVYVNDATPLATKLPAAVSILQKQISLGDLLRAVVLGSALGVATALRGGRIWLRRLFGSAGTNGPANGTHSQTPALRLPQYAQAADQAGDLTAAVPAANQKWEARLAQLGYETVKTSHIHVFWPEAIPDKDQLADAGLLHVCPAHVYEARRSPSGQLQVVVNFENCIKCETCWRTSPRVDWARDGQHRFVYAVHSPVVTKLLEAQDAAGLSRPLQCRESDFWQANVNAFQDLISNQQHVVTGWLSELDRLIMRLERKLAEFDRVLDDSRTLDGHRRQHLNLLARYALQLARRMVELFPTDTSDGPLHEPLRALATELERRLAKRMEQIELHQRYTWAAADGRHARQHHLAGLRRYLEALQKHSPSQSATDPTERWLRAEANEAAVDGFRTAGQARLDAVFGAGIWRDLEQQVPLTGDQDAVLRELTARVPLVDEGNLAATVHPPERKWLLAELGRRDPSLAYRVASHLWARDLAARHGLAEAAQRWARGDEWACFAALEGSPAAALLVPARRASCVLILCDNLLAVARLDGTSTEIKVEPLQTLGLRGAGLTRVTLGESLPAEAQAAVVRDRVLREWRISGAMDLCAIAYGMADLLCRRAIEHATSRVQFPGLFHDEAARDTIGKFGAVKKMIAEMVVRRRVIETLEHNLSPVDFTPASEAQCCLIKAIVAELLGTAPGSVAYNAGQVFGGTGYSEDDLLAKYYRDAAAWRFLGPDNVAVFSDHGRQLLERWGDEADAFSTLPHEVELFADLEQRAALGEEWQSVREKLSRLSRQVHKWRAFPPESERDSAQISETLGRLDGQVLASRALLLRTHCRLEQGLPAELDTALVRHWLGELDLAIRDCHEQLQHARDRAARQTEPLTPTPSPPQRWRGEAVESSSEPPITLYADFLRAPCPYDSGDFLVKPADPAQPRYVPELIDTDPLLAEWNRRLIERISSHFGMPRDGLVYERYIEREHPPDDSDLAFCRRHGYLRMPIPKDLGGEGKSKAEYYLLTSNIHRLSDGAVSLTVQVNSSLGTTPVLLPRDKDLPKAQKDLGAFAGDTSLQQDIRDRLRQMLEQFASPDVRELTRGFGDVQKRLDEGVLSRQVLRVLAHGFIGHWQEAGRAGKAYDLTTMRRELADALAAWEDACARAAEMLEEIGRRREASDLFLRWVASGQISAFALTEPSAGSDTARVATRARLRSAPVQALPDGRYRCIPAGGKEPRYLLDARRLEFRRTELDDGAEVLPFYRWSEAAPPAPVRFDEYDYETDDPQRMRYFERDGERCHFTDVAQLREREGQLWYDYWELTGAKMWITNGRTCGIMCLYAKTEEGVTGFIVDRHAEGLVVGKDEAKLGQCGSPTNELALQMVRVPRENVIGLEGRGQVNALETLNVGRAGLAMSAMTQMKRLTDLSRAFAEEHLRDEQGELPSWVVWRLQRVDEDRFISEALSHDIIGRFEHKQTKSVRVESAAAKMLVSELLHRVIETAEEIHGLAGQTQEHLVEKRKRDARVLNIYEGTNEIQRFLILKDLTSDLIGRWPQRLPVTLPDRALTQLELIKHRVRQRVLPAFSMFGQQLWQNPNLQANCFLLSEAVAWVAAADSTLARLTWLRRHTRATGKDYAALLETGERAFERCLGEIRVRLEHFDEELEELRWWRYAPAVQAASLLFAQHGQPASPQPLASRIAQPLSVLVVLDPLVPGVPQPRVQGGKLLEPYRVLSEADRAALETALRLRDSAGALVNLQVATVGPRAVAQVLRDVLGLGIGRVRLLVTPEQAVAPDRAAWALAATLRTEPAFDLILTGAGSGDSGEGLVGKLTAEALGVPFVGTAAQIAVETGSDGGMLLLSSAGQNQKRIRSLPVAVGIESGATLRSYTIAGYLAGLPRNIKVLSWPASAPVEPIDFLPAAQFAGATSTEKAPQPLAPHEASQLVLETLGLAATHDTSMAAHGPENRLAVAIQDVAVPFGAADSNGAPPAVLAVLAAESDGRLRPTAKRALDAAQLVTPYVAAGTGTAVLLLVSRSEDAQRQAVAEVWALSSSDICLLAVDASELSDEIRSRILAECWSDLRPVSAVIIGEPWTESAFAQLAARSPHGDTVALRVRALERHDGRLVAETSQARGKLRARQTLHLGGDRTCWISVTADVELGAVPPAPSRETPAVWRWSPRLEAFYGQADLRRLLEELKRETGVVRLSDAEFIIDVGFGVGNRDGYEAVIEPLERALRALGVRSLMIGGSRKVTEELHLLAADRQIGQSGVSVQPRVLLAVGVSGAPQHLNCIGPRATILAFNRDPEAPIMTLNQRQPQPRVFPVVGDLFATVPAFTECLREETEGLQPAPREPVLQA